MPAGDTLEDRDLVRASSADRDDGSAAPSRAAHVNGDGSFNPTRVALLQRFRLDADIVAGDGCHLFDATGRAYLDCLAQYGAVPFGHNPPELWEALHRAQRQQLAPMVQPLLSREAVDLTRRLAAVAPGDLGVCTLVNSGAEAVEAAIKLARARTRRHGIVSAVNSFHGKTLGALSATGKPRYQKDFGAPASGFGHVPFGDIDALRQLLSAGAEDIGAVILEPIQGEGGCVVPPADYLAQAVDLCRQHRVLSIVDEIQTGLGRTGALFRCSELGIVPDMLLIAKALGGGLLPIGACIAREEVWDDRFGQLHSSTFANNSLACRVAATVLDLLLDDGSKRIRHVAQTGEWLGAELARLKERYPQVIRDVRGVGFMRGVEFQPFDGASGHPSATMAFCSLNGGVTAVVSSYLFNRHHVVTAPLFNDSHVLRIQPPLTITKGELSRLVDGLDEICAFAAGGRYDQILRHLVAVREYRSPRRTARYSTRKGGQRVQKPLDRFAFLVHYTNSKDLIESDPSFANFEPDEIDRWFEWAKDLGSGYLKRTEPLTSDSGAQVEGWIVSVPLLPHDMIGKQRREASTLIAEGVDLAIGQDCGRVGLGGFTSIATRGGTDVTGRGAAVTSGNTLTAVCAVQAVEEAARLIDVDLGRARVAVVGATGAIGRLAALLLAPRVGALTIVGNHKNPQANTLCGRIRAEVIDHLATASPTNGVVPVGLLARTSAMLARGRPPGVVAATSKYADEDFDHVWEELWQDLRPSGLADLSAIAATTDLPVALKTSDVVLFATSAEGSLADPADLRPGAIACDVAKPSNLTFRPFDDLDAFVFDGGLVELPQSLDLRPVQSRPSAVCWGCLAETILLALEGEPGDFGVDPASALAHARRLEVLASKHGFRPAPMEWQGLKVGAPAFLDHVRNLVPHDLRLGAAGAAQPTVVAVDERTRTLGVA